MTTRSNTLDQLTHGSDTPLIDLVILNKIRRDTVDERWNEQGELLTIAK